MNVRRPSLLGLTITAVLVLLLAPARPAAAQKTTLPPSVITSSPQGAVIGNQLRMAAKLGREALAGIEALPRDDSVPIDEATLQAARNTYVLIRAARHGLELSKASKKFGDPLQELAYKRLTDAWNLARGPVDRASSGISRQEYISSSVRDLSQSLRLVDQVLVLLP
jgi:hypothetical protein